MQYNIHFSKADTIRIYILRKRKKEAVVDFMSAKEAAEKWSVSLRWVQKLCGEDRVKGIKRFGRAYMIPRDTERPGDLRRSEKKGGMIKKWRNSMFHILVVDDDKHTRMLLRAILQNANYTVSTANDGEEALNVLDHEHIDLVVLDIMMPKMDGYEFTKLIRETDNSLPILMVTAKHMPADEKRGFLVRNDDYITKPIDGDKLCMRIKALLRRSKIVSEQKIVIGDVTLDYSSFTVSRNGETQELTQKEFLLLYKLLSYPGQIFTRIQLMDEIWGTDSETGWETVTVHVGRLRKRFEGWEEFEIESVRGLGYKAVKKV